MEMTPFEIGILGFVLLFLLMAVGMPIAFAMGLAGFLGIWYLEGSRGALATVGMMPFSWAADYSFMCIPLFVLMGHFANKSGVVTRAFEAAYKWVGSLPGGLAIATTIGSGAFGAVSGSSSAAAATMATVCVPEMEKYHYSPKLMTGSVAVGGTFAILIPPSLGFILYGIITGESIGRLFIAGIIPGIIMVAMISLTIAFMCKKNPLLGPAGPPSTLMEKLISLTRIWEVLLIFLAVIGGIYLGVFTPTEAASVGVLITLIFALAKRTLSKTGLIEALVMTARITIMIFALIIGAMIFNNFITLSGIPMKIQAMITGLGVNPYLVLSVILFSYLVFGCVMDAVAMTVLLLPIYYPIIIALGFNGVWFGVIGTVMAEIGLMTPPIGLNCFVVSGVLPKYRVETVFRGILPFIPVDIAIVILLVIFPKIALFLPNLMK
jgi:C4-dicarboxylate transporter, DctM subunit